MKNEPFSSFQRHISKTVGDAFNVTITDMRFRLTPRLMSWDGLDQLYVPILLEFRGISQIWEPTTAKRMKILSATEL